MRYGFGALVLVGIGLVSFANCASNEIHGLDPGTPVNPGSGGTSQTSTAPTSPSPEAPDVATAPDVAATQPPPSATDCPQVVVTDPAVAMAGVTLYQPGQKLANPAAGDPSYVYLTAGTEGVVLEGPTVTDVAGLASVGAGAGITMVGVRSTSADGYDVVVNPSLRYHVAIADFEFEVALARVELCDQSGNLRSRFVFKGNAGASGVAHTITITPTTTATVTSVPAPVTVEVR
jgi:hypothetical protein